MKFDNFMYLEFPCKSANVSLAVSAVAAFAAQLDPTVDELGDIRTAVSEAVTNCVDFAYPNSLGNITIRCRVLKDNTLGISIKDKGVGIENLNQARTAMFTTAGDSHSGMGFTIMESFMSTFSVTSKPDCGTSIHMSKKLQRRNKQN